MVACAPSNEPFSVVPIQMEDKLYSDCHSHQMLSADTRKASRLRTPVQNSEMMLGSLIARKLSTRLASFNNTIRNIIGHGSGQGTLLPLSAYVHQSQGIHICARVLSGDNGRSLDDNLFNNLM